MSDLTIPLKAIVVDTELNRNLAALPPDEALDQLKKCYAFLSPSVTVRIEGENAIVTLPADKAPQAGQATSDYQAGLRHAQRGEYDKAIRLFRRAVEALPTRTDARRNLGMAYLEAGQRDKAVTCTVETLRLNPNDLWALTLMGNIYSKQEGRSDVAQKYYQKAFAIDPTDTTLLNSYGALVAKAGKFDEAHDLFERALKSDPTYPNSHFGLALLYMNHDQPNRAVETVDKLFAQPRFPKIPRSKPVYAEARRLAAEAENQMALRSRQAVKDWVDMRARIVSELTGYRVELLPDPSLKGITATAQAAWTHGRDRHIVRYRDSQPLVTPHLLGHELEHIVLEHEARTYGRHRTFSSTTDDRDYAIRSLGDYERKMLRLGYTQSNLNQLVSDMVYGLANQLYNCPLDMIIEHRLYHAHAVLRPSQFLSLEATQRVNAGVVQDKNIQRVSPPNIFLANLAMNCAYALFADNLYNGMTDYAAPYRNSEGYDPGNKLFLLGQATIRSFKPGDEYDLVDEFARLLQLEHWYTWRVDSQREAKVEGPTNAELLKAKESATVMYCLGALQRFEDLPPDGILPIVSEIALLGRGGIDYTSPDERYTLHSIPGETFSGLQLLCLMYVGFKKIDPFLDTGLDFADAYEQAVRLHESGK